MRIRAVLTISLLALIPKTRQDPNKLLPVINDLSILARLINGISVQSEFMRSSQNLNAVVGELLGIGDSIPELLKVKVKDLIKDVEGVMEDVKGLPQSSNQNLEAIGETMKFLKSIDLEKLKKVAQLDLTTLTTNWDTAKKANPEIFYPLTFSKAVTSLKEIMETEIVEEMTAIGDMYRNLKSFFANAKSIKTTFAEIQKNLPEAKSYEHIHDTKSQLQDLPYLAQGLRKYLENMGSLVSLHQSFTDMKAAIDKVKPIIQKSQASSATNQTLGAMTLLSSDKLTDKKLTAGFQNGISDFKLLFDDLNGEWLKENVADGKDMKMMVTALEPLKKFYENLKPLETSWGKLRKDPETGRNIGNIATLLKNGKILNPDELTSKLDPAAKCSQSFKPVMIADEFDNFDKFYSKLDAFYEDLKFLKEAVEKVTGSPDFKKIIDFKWRSLGAGKTLTGSNEEVKREVNALRDNVEIQEMSKLLFEYAGALEKIDISRIKDMMVLWNSVVVIQTTQEDIELVKVLDCLATMKFDYTATEAFSTFDREVQALKSQNNVEKSMKLFEGAIGSLISVDKKLKETVNGMKVSRRRKRSAQGPKSLLKLTNSGKMAQDLANGVEVLREISEVFDNRDKVLKVAKSVDSVDTVIQSIPEMAGKWTVDNKKALEKLVKEVSDFDRRVPITRNFENLWALFEEGSTMVNGAPIDGRILGTLVFKELEKSNDQTVKSGAADFKDFPPLQLDFTGSKRIHLQQASGILKPITAFFKDFFAVEIITSTQPTEPPPNYLLFAGAGAGALLLIAAVGVGVYYGKTVQKRKKEDKIWEDRERKWLYILFQNEKHIHDLPRLIKEGNSDSARSQVCRGAFVNVFVDGQSALHLAVNYGSPALVELMILNGADMKALDVNGKTPAEVFDPKPVNPHDNENELARRKEMVGNILKKYKGTKQSRQILPDLLPYERFVVCSLASDKSTAFEAKYLSKMMFFKKPGPNLTHLIVEVDDQGVYHCEKTKMGGLDKFYSVAFGPVISVSTEWPKLCMQSEDNIYKDYDCRVKKVEYNGKIYTNVDRMKEFARGRHIEIGLGCQLSYLHCRATMNPFLEEAIELFKFNVYKGRGKHPNVAEVDPNAKSFYRPDMKANFIVYEGESIEEFSSRLEGVELKDYTVMSLDEFTVFLLDEMDGKEKGKTASTTKTASTVKTIE